MRIEKGIKIGTLTPRELRGRATLDGILKKFDWLYLGSEFCENLLSDPEELARTAVFFCDRGKKVCLMTPFLSDKGIASLKSLFSELKKLKGRGLLNPDSIELTVNDIGALELERECGLGLKINAGRILYENVFELRKKHLSVLNRYALEAFSDMGITRFELSTTGVLPKTNFGDAAAFGFDPGDFTLTLFYPYINITSTRTCLMGMPDTRPHGSVSGINCRRECRTAAFEIDHPLIKEKLIAQGNALFLKFPGKFYDREKELLDRRVDRLVYCPFP